MNALALIGPAYLLGATVLMAVLIEEAKGDRLVATFIFLMSLLWPITLTAVILTVIADRLRKKESR